MTPQTVLDVGRDALWMCLLLAGGPLLAMLVVGLVVGMLQAATQINEMTLSFVPKLIAMALLLVVASVLMSLGMMMLSPMIISLPFKIMLFVLVDGWSLVLGTLAGSFYR